MKKIIIFISMITILSVASIPAFASTVTFDFDIPENPKDLKHLSSAEIVNFYKNISYKDILDKSQSDIIKKEINIDGKNHSADIYIRTFSISDAINIPVSDAEAAMNNYLNNIIDQISTDLQHKFHSTITVALGANMSATFDNANGVISELLLSIAFAVGEKAENIENDVVNNFVKPNTAK